MVSARSAGLVHSGAPNDVIQALLQILEVLRQAENRHNLGRHGDIEPALHGVAVGGATDAGDHTAQLAIVDVHHPPPGDAVRVNIQACKARDFFRRQVVGIGLIDPQLLQALNHNR